MQANRRPHQNAGEPHASASAGKNRGGDGVIQQHRRDQSAQGAAGPVVARQPAGDAQREQRSAAMRPTTSAASASSDAPSSNLATSGGDNSSPKPAPTSTSAIAISSLLATTW